MIDGKKQIKIGAILSYVAIIFNIIMGLVYTPWMIAQVGKEQYGLYTLATSLITFFVMDFGLSAATARYVAKYKAEENQQQVNNFLGAIYKIYIVIDLILFVFLTIVFIFLESIYVELTPTELSQFKVVFLIAAAFTLVDLPFITLNGILTAYEKFIQLKLADLLYKIVLVGLTVGGLLLGWGLYALVSVYALSGILTIIYKLVVIKATTPVKVNLKYKDKKLSKEIVIFSLWVAISALAQRLIFVITPSILGIVASSTAIAVFGIVTLVESYSYTVTTAINGMFMPKISKIYLDDKPQEKLMPLMVKVGKFQFAVNGLIIVGFAILGSSFINLWLSGDSTFKDAYWGILLVIIPGLFFNSLQVANTALTVAGKVKEQALYSIAYGVLNVVLSFILASKFGVLGACVSIFVAYMARAVIYHIMHKRILKLNIWYFIKQCYFRMAPSIVITLALGFVMNYFIPDAGWIRFLIKGIIVVAIYLASTLFLCFNKIERKGFYQKIGKMLNRKQKSVNGDGNERDN